MTRKQIYALSWVAGLLTLAGLVLCFSSASLGIKYASAWLEGQAGGIANTSLYPTVVESGIGMFNILGSILFAIGVLLVLATCFVHLLFRKPDEIDTEVFNHKSL